MDSNSPVSSTDVSANAQGVSNPPDGGAVNSVDTPQDQMQTGGTQQPQPQPQQPQTQQPQGQQQQQQQQPGDQGQDQMAVKQPDLSGNSNKLPEQPLQTAPLKDHPAVQRASILHTIAETLAGGPRYTESVDVNTGQMTRQRVPLSRADIGMAIAMEAISGALAGLTQKGPGATGRAAAAGFQQTAMQRQQVQQQQDEQANADFARHYQVLDTNMRLRQNALTVGRMDYDANKDYVGQWSGLSDYVMNNHRNFVKDIVNYSDFGKYHVTTDSAIPYKVVPRLDQNGQQIENNGVKQWDIQYLVVDPNLKADDFLTPEDLAAAKKYNIPGLSAENMPKNVMLRLGQYINLKSKIAALEMADDNFKNYGQEVNSFNTSQPTKTPILKTPEWNALADQGAKEAGVSPALVRAVLHQEDAQEDPGAVNQKSGATGPAQFMPATAKKYGLRVDGSIDDRKDPEKAIPAAARYLSDLIKQYNGDIKTALAAYNGAANPTDPSTWKPETQNYVANITNAIGLQSADQSGAEYKPVNLSAEIAKDPTLPDKLDKFTALVHATTDDKGVHYQKAIAELAKSDPQAAGTISRLFGGDAMLSRYEQNNALTYDVNKKQAEAQAKQKIDEDASAKMSAVLKGPANFQYTPDMANLSMDDLAAKLESQGVTVPQNFPSLYGVAKLLDSPKDYASRTWKKGAPLEMDQQEAISYIRKYINKGYAERDYTAAQKTVNDFTTDSGKESQQLKSVNTLYDHIGDAYELINTLRNTNSPLINKPMNEFKKEMLGDPNVTSMLAAIDPVKTEFMTFLNNNHALTESDKKAGDDLLAMHFTPAQLEGQLKQFAKTAAYRLLEVNNQWKRNFGRNAPGLISEQALKTIGKMPEVAEILKDMDTGGTMLAGDTGYGQYGQTVAQALNMSSKAVGTVHMYNGKLVKIVGLDPKTGQPQVVPVTDDDQQQPQQPQPGSGGGIMDTLTHPRPGWLSDAASQAGRAFRPHGPA